MGVKQQELNGVREYCEKYPVELWRNPNGRLTILARNEGGNNITEVDLRDLMEWLQFGPSSGRTAEGFQILSGAAIKDETNP